MSITREFLRAPAHTGAIAASSRRLAAAVVAGIGVERAAHVVELGPGTGVFTEALLARLRPGARLTAVEVNPRLAGDLARRHPGVEVITGSAEHLAGHVRAADVVVSGLPWSLFPGDRQDRVLDQVGEVLAPGGRFATFAYLHAAWLPAARRFEAALARRFGFVGRSRVVWGNLPPAFVHRAAVTP
ncbi:methyltransferase domain-containing protein [Amycolatopsis thermalba]|uniref:Methyltransferase domain-containing protein n=1 Tax=Amycolatopsis thermalba TaxID=944492 RepID=A0ABY4P4S3_9PSEU|nr:MULTISPECIES: methyltransferase domain-containing protein [Amycolatopsis]OXM73260.1 methyltransferase [Amycolatopsis sp. KNN50.9b]UQS27242.1 methyltransferase domain-containing protein [Amycolatopsis thermalba]